MALTLVRLKLAMQVNSLRSGSAGQRVGYALLWVLAIVGGTAAGATVAAALGTGSAPMTASVLAMFTAVFAAWVLTPLTAPVGDNSVDPETLAPYPLSSREKVTGLLLAGLIGPGGLFTLLFALGPALVPGADPAARVFAALGAVVFTVLCVAASRALLALLAGFLGSNRGKAVAIAITTVVFLVIYLASQSTAGIARATEEAGATTAVQVLSALPPGAVGRSQIAVGTGEWGVGLLFLSYAIVAILACLAVWGIALRRQQEGRSGVSASGTSGRTRTQLYPSALQGLPRTAVTSSLAVQWRYYLFRAPRALQALVIGVVVGTVVGHGALSSGSGLATATGVLTVLIVFEMNANVLGQDGAGFGYLVLSGAPMKSVLTGYLLLAPIVTLPLMVLFAVVEGFWSGVPTDIGPAILVGAAAGAASFGVGAFLSARFPINAEHKDVGREGRTKALTMIMVSAVLLLILTYLLGWPVASASGPWDWIYAAVELLGCLVFAGLATAFAGRDLQRTQLQALARLVG